MHEEKHNLWLIVHLGQQSMQLAYGLVKDDVCPYAGCIDCCTKQSNDAHIDSDLVDGGGGDCTKLLLTALTYADTGLDLCTSIHLMWRFLTTGASTPCTCTHVSMMVILLMKMVKTEQVYFYESL